MSDVIEEARANVLENGLAERITLLRGKIEQIDLPDVGRVDVIVSEWMGYFLLYESMLDSVLAARDRFGGRLLPDHASLYACAIEAESNRYGRSGMCSLGIAVVRAHGWSRRPHLTARIRLSFWNDVYGFRMSAVRARMIQEPLVAQLESTAVILSAPHVLWHANLATVTPAELQFTAPLHLVMRRSGRLAGLCCWFDVLFDGGSAHPVLLTTAPDAPATHWKQTLLYLDGDHSVAAGDVLTGTLTVQRTAENRRALHIDIAYSLQRVPDDRVPSAEADVGRWTKQWTML